MKERERPGQDQYSGCRCHLSVRARYQSGSNPPTCQYHSLPRTDREREGEGGRGREREGKGEGEGREGGRGRGREKDN